MRHIRRHLEALPTPGPAPRPELVSVSVSVSDDDRVETMAIFILTTGRDTLMRLRAVEDDADALSALLRSLSSRELAGADVCAGARDRDAFLSRMIAYEEGRRAGVDEATCGGGAGGAA